MQHDFNCSFARAISIGTSCAKRSGVTAVLTMGGGLGASSQQLRNSTTLSTGYLLYRGKKHRHRSRHVISYSHKLVRHTSLVGSQIIYDLVGVQPKNGVCEV